jgi:hypothetical protein
VRRPLTDQLYQPHTIDDECGAVGGMRIGRGNRSARRTQALVLLCPLQIPHDLTWARTRDVAVGSWPELNVFMPSNFICMNVDLRCCCHTRIFQLSYILE